MVRKWTVAKLKERESNMHSSNRIKNGSLFSPKSISAPGWKGKKSKGREYIRSAVHSK
jgi:hypothetical protein